MIELCENYKSTGLLRFKIDNTGHIYNVKLFLLKKKKKRKSRYPTIPLVI